MLALLRPSVGRSLLAAALFGLLLAAPAGARERGDGARVRLPGAREVRPGQWIELAWSPVDSVSELEILLSVDGGRHFDRWATPRLSGSRTRVRWQVPADAGTDLRMRIRFNRAGREIEAAPVTRIRLAADDVAEPLALPPLERDPAAPGRGGDGPAGARAGAAAEETGEACIAPAAESRTLPALAAVSLRVQPGGSAALGLARPPARSTPLRP